MEDGVTPFPVGWLLDLHHICISKCQRDFCVFLTGGPWLWQLPGLLALQWVCLFRLFLGKQSGCSGLSLLELAFFWTLIGFSLFYINGGCDVKFILRFGICISSNKNQHEIAWSVTFKKLAHVFWTISLFCVLLYILWKDNRIHKEHQLKANFCQFLKLRLEPFLKHWSISCVDSGKNLPSLLAG